MHKIYSLFRNSVVRELYIGRFMLPLLELDFITLPLSLQFLLPFKVKLCLPYLYSLATTEYLGSCIYYCFSYKSWYIELNNREPVETGFFHPCSCSWLILAVTCLNTLLLLSSAECSSNVLMVPTLLTHGLFQIFVTFKWIKEKLSATTKAFWK